MIIPWYKMNQMRSVAKRDNLYMLSLFSSKLWSAQLYERNLSNCVQKPEKSGLQRGLNPAWHRDAGPTLQPTELWSHRSWKSVISGFKCSRDAWTSARDVIYEVNHTLNCGYVSDAMNFSNCVYNHEDHSLIWFHLRSSIYVSFHI